MTLANPFTIFSETAWLLKAKFYVNLYMIGRTSALIIRLISINNVMAYLANNNSNNNNNNNN